MEDDGKGASEPADGFAVHEVALGLGRTPLVDAFGHAHYVWRACELTITPDGDAAWCDVSMISDPAGRLAVRPSPFWRRLRMPTRARRRPFRSQMAYRRLRVGTEGVVLLAKNMLGLALNYKATDMSPEEAKFHITMYSTMILRFPFDTRSGDRAAREYFESLGLWVPKDAPEMASIHTEVNDAMSAETLASQFVLAKVGEVPGGVAVVYPHVALGFMDVREDGIVGYVLNRDSDDDSDAETPWGDREPRRFRLAAPSCQLLIAVHEAHAYVAQAERRGDIAADVVARQREELLVLEEQTLDEIDVLDGYRQLIGLFDSGAREVVDLGHSQGQLNAASSMAMEKWLARRGRPSAGRPIDMARVAAASGVEPVPLGDEFVLQFDCGKLVFRVEGDLVTGHGLVIGADDDLRYASVALTADTLELVAWAMAAVDQLDGDIVETLRDIVTRALETPWSGLREAVALAGASFVSSRPGAGTIRRPRTFYAALPTRAHERLIAR